MASSSWGLVQIWQVAMKTELRLQQATEWNRGTSAGAPGTVHCQTDKTHSHTYTHLHTRQLKTYQLSNAIPVAQSKIPKRHVAEQTRWKYFQLKSRCVCYFVRVCVCVWVGGYILRPGAGPKGVDVGDSKWDKTRLMHVISSLCHEARTCSLTQQMWTTEINLPTGQLLHHALPTSNVFETKLCSNKIKSLHNIKISVLRAATLHI